MIEEVFQPIRYTELGQEELRNNVVFFATLSDGKRAYSKPGRRSWLELKTWLKENPSITMEALHFQFRDNYHEIGRGHEGYFFSHGIQCFFGCPEQYCFIGGYVKDGYIFRQRFLTPELIANDDDRDVYPINHVEMQKGLYINGKNV